MDEDKERLMKMETESECLALELEDGAQRDLPGLYGALMRTRPTSVVEEGNDIVWVWVFGSPYTCSLTIEPVPEERKVHIRHRDHDEIVTDTVANIDYAMYVCASYSLLEWFEDRCGAISAVDALRDEVPAVARWESEIVDVWLEVVNESFGDRYDMKTLLRAYMRVQMEDSVDAAVAHSDHEDWITRLALDQADRDLDDMLDELVDQFLEWCGPLVPGEALDMGGIEIEKDDEEE